MASNLDEEFTTGPLSILTSSMMSNTHIHVVLRNNKKMKGLVKSFDKHLNMVLEDVTVMWEENSINERRIYRETFVNKFVRGDSVAFVINTALLAQDNN